MKALKKAQKLIRKANGVSDLSKSELLACFGTRESIRVAIKQYEADVAEAKARLSEALNDALPF